MLEEKSRQSLESLHASYTPLKTLHASYTPLHTVHAAYTPLTLEEKCRQSETSVEQLRARYSLALLVQKYLLTGTEVQRLTTAESLSSFKTVEDQKSSLARQLKEKTQELDEVKEKSMGRVC